MVNNAGFGIHASFAETTEQQFDDLLNVHLKGGVVASLLSEDCRWINGQRIEVSGGVFL